MLLSITQFKKSIKLYLTKATQEDIYLIKYGKVVAKLSGCKEAPASEKLAAAETGKPKKKAFAAKAAKKIAGRKTKPDPKPLPAPPSEKPKAVAKPRKTIEKQAEKKPVEAKLKPGPKKKK